MSIAPKTATMLVHWLSIDFGHLSSVPDTTSHSSCTQNEPTDEQKEVLAVIPKELRSQLAAGGKITVPADPKNDDWVADYLTRLLALMFGDGLFDIQRCDVVDHVGRAASACGGGEAAGAPAAAAPAAAAGAAGAEQTAKLATSPDFGTHCRLRGDKWINERTYRLYQPGVGGAPRKAWLVGPKRHAATVTLVWLCRELAGGAWMSGSGTDLPWTEPAPGGAGAPAQGGEAG